MAAPVGMCQSFRVGACSINGCNQIHVACPLGDACPNNACVLGHTTKWPFSTPPPTSGVDGASLYGHLQQQIPQQIPQPLPSSPSPQVSQQLPLQQLPLQQLPLQQLPLPALSQQPPPPAATTEKPKKRGLCQKNRGGKCNFGAQCKFAHEPCRWQLQCKDNQCLFGHPAEWKYADTPFPKPKSRRSKPKPADKDKSNTKPKPADKDKSNTKPKSTSKPKPKSESKLPDMKVEDIFKLINSKAGKILPKSNQYSFHHEGQKHHYKFSVSNQDKGEYLITHESQTSAPAQQVILGEPAVFAVSEGLFAYDPNKHYPVGTKLAVTMDYNLNPIPQKLIELPEPPGSSYFKVQGATLLFMIPYKLAEVTKKYIKKVAIYRFNRTSNGYESTGEFEMPNFHFTCASATSNFMALGRLPYDPDLLTTMHQKEEITRNLNQVILGLQQQLTVSNNQVQQLQLQAQIQQMQQQQERQRQEEEKRRYEEEKRRHEEERRRLLAAQQSQQDTINSLLRNRDPFDFLVFDETSSKWIQVIDFPKPVDDVQVSVIDAKTMMYVFVNQHTHAFEVTVKPSQVRGMVRPIRPKKIWPDDDES